jgi:hypothetical protein
LKPLLSEKLLGINSTYPGSEALICVKHGFECRGSPSRGGSICDLTDAADGLADQNDRRRQALLKSASLGGDQRRMIEKLFS